MDASTVIDYLGKLLNRSLDPDTPIRLSSAQRARFNAWLHAQGVARNDGTLAGEFTVSYLMEGKIDATPQAVNKVLDAHPTMAAMPGALDMGIDIQCIDELMAGVANRHDFKSDSELSRLFTMRELSYAQSRTNPAETLAGLFAAKEAIRKCMGGAPISAEAFRGLEVLPDEYGKPVAAGFSLSISHSGNYAIAVAARAQLTVVSNASTKIAPAEAVVTTADKSHLRVWHWPMRFAILLLLLLSSLHGFLLYRQLT